MPIVFRSASSWPIASSYSLRASRPTRHFAPETVARTESPEQSAKYLALTVCQLYVVSCQPVTEIILDTPFSVTVSASQQEQLSMSSMFFSFFAFSHITESHTE